MQQLRKLAVTVVVLLGLTTAAAPTIAAAKVHVPASLVAEVIIMEDPGICRSTRHALHMVGYELAEEAFEAGYGQHKHPSAAAVFHSLVKQCRR
jgi:hypothetical protein